MLSRGPNGMNLEPNSFQSLFFSSFDPSSSLKPSTVKVFMIPAPKYNKPEDDKSFLCVYMTTKNKYFL
uniref:Ovule protein n=1 Tax=Caenorhabditis tropicalis TaxID=1561998 RepID=A0A1I7TX89_9PELO